jgi:predicted phosphoribosyltransferase
VVFLATPRRFGSVGSFYRDFGQVSDEEVAGLLRAAASRSANLSHS